MGSHNWTTIGNLPILQIHWGGVYLLENLSPLHSLFLFFLVLLAFQTIEVVLICFIFI